MVRTTSMPQTACMLARALDDADAAQAASD
jgi:hypothetical protein